MAIQMKRVPIDLFDLSSNLHLRHEVSTPLEERKKRGQVFTPPSIAHYMAELSESIPQDYRILDPGCGIGVLSVAICHRILRLRSPRKITIDLFENDPHVIPLLIENMENCRLRLEETGHTFKYKILQEDFILSNAHYLQQTTFFDILQPLESYNLVIMNPPYFKIGKDSSYAQIMEHIVHGQPNIYALFMALATEMLRPGGEMVSITPRSFCNGLYFRGFRRWLFKRMALCHIHLFESRTEVFRADNILQESVITRFQKKPCVSASVSVSTSFARELDLNYVKMEIPNKVLIDTENQDFIIRIPENGYDFKILKIVEKWPDKFQDLGLRISTGPVVSFRATEFLLHTIDEPSSVPLLSVHNVHPFETRWPLSKNGKPVAFKQCEQSIRLLSLTSNYVLLRRFSSKEEKRRLVASCFFKQDYPSIYIALENHLNYLYHSERELVLEEVYGLAAILNSALFDRYFRTISGNTQVNATELRVMKFPELEKIQKIGKSIVKLGCFDLAAIEKLILSELNINGEIQRYLLSTIK